MKRTLSRLGLALLLLASAGGRATADDTDLLRFNTAKPYVFLLLDNSASMTLAPGDVFVDANGDDPRSKIYQAKQALYEVFSNVDDIHVGFATFNQNRVRVRAKHYLYRVSSGGQLAIGYPAPEELMTLGAHFDIGTPGVAGSCDAPLSLINDREKISRFAKLGAVGNEQTEIWLSAAGRTYLMTVFDPSGQTLGSSSLGITFRLDRVQSCVPLLFDSTQSVNVGLKLETEFLMRDLPAPAVTTVSLPLGLLPGQGGDTGGQGGGQVEPAAGFWEWEDALAAAGCEEAHPFTGLGWEGNYDSGVVTGDPTFDTGVTNVDPFCGPAGCDNLKYETSVSALGRAMDSGDQLPLHWTVDNIQTMLSRLAPNHPDGGVPEYRVAPYFNNLPDPVTGNLTLKSPNRKPIITTGTESPLAKAIADFRCWYLGQGANKCGNFGAPAGWENIAKTADTEWGCRRPYLIVIGDGGDTCVGENPCADVANLNSLAGVRSWVVTFGGVAQPPLTCIAENGKGELVFVDTKDNLKDELNRILGVIREEARAFASAAAPSVQAIVENKIYVSTFVPLNNKSVWDGHLDAFLKPLPLNLAGEPDRTASQFLWDAGAEISGNQAPTQTQADGGDLRLGSAANQRRVFYTRGTQSNGTTTAPGALPTARRLLEVTSDATPAPVRYDLWKGLQIPFSQDVALLVDQTAQNRANGILADTLAIKQHTLADGSSISYVLGDIFHSDPLVIGSPANVRLFAQNVGDDGTACADGNPSYRCFFRKHQFRRKMLTVGANDGMLHFIDAGIASSTVVGGQAEISFNNGSGKEIAAYVPRAALPAIRQSAEGNVHRWSVDGSPVGADVFIDPLFTTAPDPAEREFRTVVISGMRRGGSTYFALDITQPDQLDEDNVSVPLNGYVPSCIGNPVEIHPVVPAADCGPVAFPSALWEFNDSVFDVTTVPARYARLDEDNNGLPDIGETWAQVAIGRVRVCEGLACDPEAASNNVRDMWVAIFGGGLDPDNKLYDPRSDENHSVRGNWLYMVDIETGQTVYKRQLRIENDDETVPAGSAVGGTAAVDTDQDGYIDRLYQATVSGHIFRVDIGLDSAGHAPSLVDTTVVDLQDNAHTVGRIPKLDSGGEPLWAPRLFFEANFDGSSPSLRPRPFYYEPSVIFVGELGLYAVAIGTGDREDLWSGGDQEGRFYVIVDDTDLLSPTARPRREGDFQRVEITDADVGTNFLIQRAPGSRGWFLALRPNQRVITDAFALSGVTFFSAFIPDVQVAAGRDPLCSKTGDSEVFIVNTTNANAFLTNLDGLRSRFLTVSTFVTQPYTEQGTNKDAGGGGSGNTGGGATADDLSDQMQAVMEAMKKLFPPECKFSNDRIDIKTIAADTGVVFIAPVPVCLIEQNWKEF